MPFIKPWSKEAEKIFNRLCRDMVTYTDDINLSRQVGRMCDDLVRQDYLDIARIDRKKKTAIIKPPGVVIFPKLTNKGLNFHFEKLRL